MTEPLQEPTRRPRTPAERAEETDLSQRPDRATARGPGSRRSRGRRARGTSILDAPLPARWGKLQRIKNTGIYAAARGAFWLAQQIPLAVMWPLAPVLGWLGCAMAVRERRRALLQLAQAMPELDGATRRRIVRRMFIHLVRSAMELTHLSVLLREPGRVHIPDEAQRVIAEALAEGRGVVVAAGHIGNWELLAQAFAAAGYPVTTIAGPLYDPRLTRWVDTMRSAFGLQVIWRGGQGGSKDMLRVFREGRILALLIDQDTRVQSVFVPFFGRPASTPVAMAALALRMGTPAVVCTIARQGKRHVIHAERCTVAPTEDRDADALALTADATARLEAAIRRAPEQWVWLHARWKRQPKPQS